MGRHRRWCDICLSALAMHWRAPIDPNADVNCWTHDDSAKTIRRIDMIFSPFCREIQDEPIDPFRMFVRRSRPAVGRQEYSRPKAHGRRTVYVMHTDACTLLLCRCKLCKSRNAVGYRVITRERQIRSRRSKEHSVARFETKKTIPCAFSGDAWNVHTVDIGRVRRFSRKPNPVHFSAETRNFRRKRALGLSRPALYQKTLDERSVDTYTNRLELIRRIHRCRLELATAVGTSLQTRPKRKTRLFRHSAKNI